MSKLLALLFLSILALSEQSENKTARSWNYRKDHKSDKNILPSKWHDHHPKCGGQFQSPTDIKFADTVYSENLKEINIESSNNDINEVWSMTNNGHSG